MVQMPAVRVTMWMDGGQVGRGSRSDKRQATKASKGDQGGQMARRSAGEPHHQMQGFEEKEEGRGEWVTSLGARTCSCPLVPFLPATRQPRRQRNLAETGRPWNWGSSPFGPLTRSGTSHPDQETGI